MSTIRFCKDLIGQSKSEDKIYTKVEQKRVESAKWLVNKTVNIRRPLLDRGIKALGLGYRSLFKNDRSCSQLSAICCEAVCKARIGGLFPLATLAARVPFFTKNVSIFKLAFRVAKTRRTAPKASKRRGTSIPNSIINDFYEKKIFTILSMRNLELEAAGVERSTQKSIKK